MIINHNMQAINAHRQLGINSTAQAKSIEKLSSGLRINRAGDDAAGLSISEKMRGQIRGLDQAIRNTQDGISLIQTAEGALDETHSILQRMRELSVQSANDTNVAADRTAIQTELDSLIDEIDRIATDTQFNSKPLLDGTIPNVTIQAGANQGQVIKITLKPMDSTELGTVTTLDQLKGGEGDEVKDTASAQKAINAIDQAIEQVSTFRSNLGATQNRLEHTVKNLGTSSENLTAAESRVRDVDMAKEMMNSTKANILAQASQAMLAQANQQPQQVLQLLR